MSNSNCDNHNNEKFEYWIGPITNFTTNSYLKLILDYSYTFDSVL